MIDTCQLDKNDTVYNGSNGEHSDEEVGATIFKDDD